MTRKRKFSTDVKIVSIADDVIVKHAPHNPKGGTYLIRYKREGVFWGKRELRSS